MEDIFSRGELLLGAQAMERLSNARVLLLGVGGVGSWAAEALVRTGVGKLTIVDSDVVSATNINRQLMATISTIGEVKVEALRNRLLTINPQAEIRAMQKIYNKETHDDFCLDSYDVIIDAIDTVADKAELILAATRTRATFLSSMGAALKVDPTKISVAEFWKVNGCPLAASLRRRFKRASQFPRKKFKCVYSPELVPNKGNEQCAVAGSMWDKNKSRINGSLAHITGIFGFTLAGLAIEAVIEPTK